MKTKRCLLTTIFALFISALSLSIVVMQRNNGEMEETSRYYRHPIVQKQSDWIALKNRLQRRKLLKSIVANAKINQQKKYLNDDFEAVNSESVSVSEEEKRFGSRLESVDRNYRLGDQSIGRDRLSNRFSNRDQLPDRSISNNLLSHQSIDQSRLSHQTSGNDQLSDQSIIDHHQLQNRVLSEHVSEVELVTANDIAISNLRSDKFYAPVEDRLPVAQENKIDIEKSTTTLSTNTHHRRLEPTIVTAIFDIGRGNWTQYRRPYSMYQDYMKRFLSLDINLVVFADSEGAKFVKEHREGKMNKTIIQEMTVQQLPLYAQFPQIKNLIDSEQASWKTEWDSSMKFHPESISPEYDILMNSKPYFVYYVANWNPFNSEYFYWLDAGYGHGQAPYPPPGTYWAPENLMRPTIGEKITFIQLGPGDVKIHTLKEMYRQGVTIVNGGFFGGNKKALGEYYHLHNKVFQDLLNRGYVDDDQTLTVLCYKENPDLFKMVVGDWYDVFRLFRPVDDKKY